MRLGKLWGIPSGWGGAERNTLAQTPPSMLAAPQRLRFDPRAAERLGGSALGG